VRALDEVMPAYDWHEVHSVEVRADAETALAAFLAMPTAPGAVTRALFRLRGLRTGGTIEQSMTGKGFAVLRRTPTEVVLGGAGRPWTPRGGIRAYAEARPGDVRMAFDVRATPLTDGRCLLSTETRTEATDARSRRSFRRYWLIVRPFSGLIRRSWLRAAASAAEATGSPGRERL